MPYLSVKTREGGFETFRAGADGKAAGRKLGVFTDQAAADGQVAALTANEKRSREKFMRLSQAQTNYTPISQNPLEACSGCMFYEGNHREWESDCRLVADWPDPIVPNGLCDEYRVRPAEPATPPLPVVIVEQASLGGAGSLDQSGITKGLSDDPSVLRRALDLMTGLTAKMLGLKAAPEPMAVGFKLLPDGRWTAVWSNNFKDREDEIFAYHAQDEYIERLNKGLSPMPVLMRFHIPGSTHGKATWVGRAGNFMLAVGTFDDTPLGRSFKSFYQKAGPQGMSHGFWYPVGTKVNGVYHYFDTFELTTLPPDAAANAYTLFDGGQKMVDITQKQRDDFTAAVGAELAGPILNGLAGYGKAIEGAGIESKAMSAPPTFEDAQARQAIKLLTEGTPGLVDAVTKMVTSVTAISEGQKAFQGKIEADVKNIGDRVGAMENFLSNTPRATKAANTQVGAAELVAAGPGAGAAAVAPVGAAATGQQQKYATQEGEFEVSIFDDLFGTKNAQAAGAPQPPPGAFVPAAQTAPAVP